MLLKKLHVVPDKKNKPNFKFSADGLNKAFTANNNKELDKNFVNSRINNLYNNTMPCIRKFSFGPIYVEDVVNLVKTIKSISSGIDNINISTINLFLSRISVILTHIINISFELNSFPERWKIALISSQIHN